MTQDEALEILKTGVNVFLTGEPGSGKTHTINAYVRWLHERGVNVAVTASTGIAATHVGGYTIHSWSGIGIKNNVSEWDIDHILTKEKTVRRILDARVLVIDEISMLDATTLDSIDRILREVRRGVLEETRSFGGLQVVFVGDFFQLPPVSKGSDISFAFESQSWKAANPVACYLSEQHRQDDGEYLDLLSAMRHGTLREGHREMLRARKTTAPAHTVATRLYTHNADVDRINTQALETIKSPTHVYQMISRGAQQLVESLKRNCLSPETLILKEGAVVMCTRNNPDAGYWNGTLADVVGFSSLGNPIIKTRGGDTITIEQIEWAIQDGNKILAKISQMPLRLAWAITVHKSQGMSLDAAVIDLGSAFEYGQGYVALSRVRTLDGLYLEAFNEMALAMHPAVVSRDAYFRNYSEAARKKFASLPQSQKSDMQKNFLRAIGAREPSPETTKKVDLAPSKLEEMRKKYPNVGKPWKPPDDVVLVTMFKADTPHAEIGKYFGRKPSAITARLGHLGLIEWDNPWKGKKGEGKKKDTE
jgi:ATP-dependent exoDNAse (exonuclease V) alpha subunit